MTETFVIRAAERGFDRLTAKDNPTYVSGHPDGFITRHSSFNFHEYQSGRAGFGHIRVFGDEVFTGAGTGYSMHPHHNFIICAFVLDGRLTHLNTLGHIDELGRDDFYAFSAGSGGQHCEVNIRADNMNAIYLWMVPDALYHQPGYQLGHFDRATQGNRLVQLIGPEPGAIPIPQQIRVSRLITDQAGIFEYHPASPAHGVYTFVVEGEAACEDLVLRRRDSAGITGAETIRIETGAGPADLLLVETAM
ncbi:pirin family protein [Roseicella sp. DB1501]|uniref:pirin family protein n=1 Tax=Roseicella sp. DB1501 TaxID=2730925 RepID=UPI001491139D|nr:pirin family protein [Roseicella sp. DB1501]NOG74120.1 pirin [Roseicella sp. DB1501]